MASKPRKFAVPIRLLPWTVTIGFLMTDGTQVTHGAPLYGIYSSGAIASGNGISAFPSQRWDFGTGTGNGLASYQPVTSYVSPLLTATGSYTSGADTVNGSGSAWVSAANGVLHGYTSVSLTGLCQSCQFATTNNAGFEIQWLDTIYLVGLPAGTPVDLLLTSVLSSSSIIDGGTAGLSSFVSLFNQSVSITNSQGMTDGLVSKSVVVHAFSGDALQLTSSLGASVSVSDIRSRQLAQIDASNTVYPYIRVLTAGASFSSASGATYVQASSVPEPGSFTLLAAALTGMALTIVRDRIRPNEHRGPNAQTAKG